MTNRLVLICVLGLVSACSSTAACPEGFTYNEDRRVCLFTGDAGSGTPPPVDSGQPDAGAPDTDAGGDLDAGGDDEDGGETDAGGGDDA